MRTSSASRLGDADVIRTLEGSVANERAATATVLPCLAEADARRLYAPAGYPSMHAYCVGKLRYSEDAAAKRIWAARTARRYPAIFEAVAAGRLHLSGVCLLAPHLTEANADELIAAATHLSKAEIERMLARRFPGTEPLPLVVTTAGPASVRRGIPAGPEQDAKDQHAPGHVRAEEHAPIVGEVGQHTPGQHAPIIDSVVQHAPGHARIPPTRMKPLAADRHTLQLTVDDEGYELIRQAQALLSHQIPSGDLAQVIVHSLREAVRQFEKRKFAATARPRPLPERPSGVPRHIPAHVRRAVHARDEGRCTFVSEGGRRCDSRTRLEYDHLTPVARGGRASVEGIRLRCRAHNQYEAERVFGAGFMEVKRQTRRACG